MSEAGGGLLARLEVTKQKAEAAKSAIPPRPKRPGELYQAELGDPKTKKPTLDDIPPAAKRMEFKTNPTLDKQIRSQEKYDKERPKTPGILKNVKYNSEPVMIGEEEEKPEEIPPTSITPYIKARDERSA